MREFLTRFSGPPLILAILAFALYLPGFWWGAPHATAADRKHSWGVDDETPLGPLTEVHGIISPKADRNLGYPLMYSLLVAAADAPYLAYLWLTGSLGSISATYPFGMADPVSTLKGLTFIAHLVTVVMAVGIILAAFDAGKSLWGTGTGILAALFAMVSFPMFYYARTGNVDVPVLFFTALALAAFARCIAGGLTTRRGIWLGVFVGFALATKEPSFSSFLSFPFVLLPLHARQTKAGLFSWNFWKAPVAIVVAAFLAFGIGSGLFLAPERFFAHLAFMRERTAMLRAGLLTFQSHFPFTLDGHRQLATLMVQYLIDSMTIPGLLLAVLGLGWTLKRQAKPALFALPALTYLLVLFFLGRAAQLRYLMPVAFTLAFFAAQAVVLAWNSHRRVVQVVVVLLAFSAIGLNLLRGVDLTHAMIYDSRYEAAEWLAGQTSSGDRIEYFGYPDHLPPLRAGVVTESAVKFDGIQQEARSDEMSVIEVKQRWLETKPKAVIIVPDFTSLPGVPHSRSCSTRVFQSLQDGSIGYKQAAFFQSPSLLPWVKRPALDYPVVNPPIHIFIPIGTESTK